MCWVGRRVSPTLNRRLGQQERLEGSRLEWYGQVGERSLGNRGFCGAAVRCVVGYRRVRLESEALSLNKMLDIEEQTFQVGGWRQSDIDAAWFRTPLRSLSRVYYIIRPGMGQVTLVGGISAKEQAPRSLTPDSSSRHRLDPAVSSSPLTSNSQLFPKVILFCLTPG